MTNNELVTLANNPGATVMHISGAIATIQAITRQHVIVVWDGFPDEAVFKVKAFLQEFRLKA